LIRSGSARSGPDIALARPVAIQELGAASKLLSFGNGRDRTKRQQLDR
jgi:hypothetical protein